MLKLSSQFLILIALSSFIGCARDNEISDLKKQIKNLQDNTKITQLTALQAIEAGKCWIERSADETAELLCGDGSSAAILNGVDGKNGADGISCTIDEVKGVGAMITCGDAKALIQNGKDGVDGENGIVGLIEVLNPCENQKLDEIILKFGPKILVAHYSDGKRQHLTKLVPGEYTTSDGFDCPFTVTEEYEILSAI